ncbi:unnamed protein product [Sphagnum jensenii]|uniref:Uncharacterized protein n=1 Tax=Sphagnum jensenii TaxID=128206 RepID=A0ABP0WM55_9BRYO
MSDMMVEEKLLAAPNTSGEHSGGGTTTLLFLALSVPFSHYIGISRKQEELQSDFLLQQWMTHISGHGL